MRKDPRVSKLVRKEAAELLALALPIAISQISRVGMGVVDTVFAGNVSSKDLAGIGLGSAIWFAVFFFVSGTLLVASPMVGQRKAKATPSLTHRAVEQVALTGVFWGVVSALVLVLAGSLLSSVQMDPYVAKLAREYSYVIALGAPACALFQGLKFSFDGLGEPNRGMRIGLFGFVANIPLNYLFVFGAFGLPGMGGIGCAWATTLVYWLMLAALLTSARRRPVIPGMVLRILTKPVAEDQRYLFFKGLPSGVTILLDAGFFSVIAWMAVHFGAISAAANQIATNFVSLLFVGQIALSMAISIRVARGKSNDEVSRTVLVGCGVSFTLSLAYMCALILFGHQIVAIYTSDSEVRGVAYGLLSVAVLFQFVDAIQVCLGGALRGMHDTFVPMIIVGFAYWVIALPISYALIYTDWLGRTSTIADVWYGLAAGISFAAVLLAARFLLKRIGGELIVPLPSSR